MISRLSIRQAWVVLGLFLFCFWYGVTYSVSEFTAFTSDHFINLLLAAFGGICVWIALESTFKSSIPHGLISLALARKMRRNDMVVNVVFMLVGSSCILWGLSYFISQ